MTRNPSLISQRFAVTGTLIDAVPYGNGHINDTFLATYQQGDTYKQYIHQRINHQVFKNPPLLMDNVQRVTQHLQHKTLSAGRRETTLTLIPTHSGEPYLRDEGGDFWRTYEFVTGARSYEVVESPAQAYEVGRAFGRFQEQLIDLPQPRLQETIPHFHHTPERFANFQQVLAADSHNRAASARPEIDFALQQADITGVLLAEQAAGAMPERVTHNDTKLNNVLLDDETGQGVCVIDLDTVMPGLALYDFGDMVRTTTCLSPEDETNLARVRLEVDLFEALARGYLSQTASFLTNAEVAYLPFAGKLITFEIGLRFLTDYLAGDTYFKIRHPLHNLERCRSQFRLVQSIAEQESRLEQLVMRLHAAAA